MTFCTGPILWPGCPRTELSAAKRGLWTDSAPMTRQFGIASAYLCACPSHRRHAAGLMVSMPRLAVASADTTMLRRRRPANVRPILFETALLQAARMTDGVDPHTEAPISEPRGWHARGY